MEDTKNISLNCIKDVDKKTDEQDSISVGNQTTITNLFLVLMAWDKINNHVQRLKYAMCHFWHPIESQKKVDCSYLVVAGQ